MNLTRFTDLAAYRDAVMDLLVQKEVANNLPIGIILRGLAEGYTDDWYMAAVTDDAGSPLLAALQTPPHNLILVEAEPAAPDPALARLAEGLRAENRQPPGVIAEQGLARRFARLWAGAGWRTHISLIAMRLDAAPGGSDAALAGRPSPAGQARFLQEGDLHFAPYWGVAFSEDCNIRGSTLAEMLTLLQGRLGKDTHLLWLDESGAPVSQAVHGRSTPGGAVVSHVYTPPWYRGKGYASACVAALCAGLFQQGHRYCALFADAANPISCGIYRKLGFRDVCTHDEIHFTAGE